MVDSRDMVVWYSNGNTFRDNYGAPQPLLDPFHVRQQQHGRKQPFYDNAVGVYLMYTEGSVVRNNMISHATGATGMGIGFKEASGTLIENNEIIYCALGIGPDLSPFQPDSTDHPEEQPLRLQRYRHHFNSDLGGYD